MTLIAYDTPLHPAPALYTGTSTSNLVPFPFPVSIDGHAYAVEWDSTAIGVWGAKIKRETLPLVRQQADNSNTPGEQSISPEQLWRRSQDTWLYGEGQTYLDRATSEIRRYHDGYGIDPWNPWQLTLLNDTALTYASSNSNLQCVNTGTYIYIIDGTNVKYSSDMTTWTTVTGITGTPVSIDTDGGNIYIAAGTNGIYSGTVGTSSVTSFVTGTVTLVRFTKDRLMAAGSGKLYNIISSGSLPTPLLDLSGRSYSWVDITGALTEIYAAGFSGDKSTIYRTQILADGTALAVPTVAAELPDGEIARSLGSYLGYVLIGTDKGVRFCQVNSDGSLTLGGIITTDAPVYCFEPQDRFVWYGLSNYDGGNSYLGRMDLTTFNATLVPAYAGDIAAHSQGTVRSVITFNNKRYFTVDGYGLVGELSTPVASGSFVSGVIAYGISDPKIAMFLDIKHEPLQGTITAGIVANKSDQNVEVTDANTLGTSSVQGSVSPQFPFPCGQLQGENFQVVLTLKPDASGNRPILTRWVLRSFPTPVRTTNWNVPLMIYPTITLAEKDWSMVTSDELNFLFDLWQTQKVVTLQVADESYQVVLYDYQWLPDAIDIYGHPRGMFYAQLKEIVG